MTTEQQKPEEKPLVTIDDFLRRYAELDQLATDYENKRKDATAKRDQIELQIVERYNLEGVNSLRVAGLGSFPMATRTFASLKAEQKARAIELMKKHYPDLVQETVNAQTLSAFVNDAAKNDQALPQELMDCLNIYKKQYLSWRK